MINRQLGQSLRVRNQLSVSVDVDLSSSIPFSAVLDPGACELYGLPEGFHRVTIRQRPAGPQVLRSFTLSSGDVFEIRVDSSLF